MKQVPRFGFLCAMACLLALSGPVIASEEWHRDMLTQSYFFSDMGPDSLCLDPDGHPAVVYGGAKLVCKHFSGTYWQTEFIDDRFNSGRHTGLKFDSSGVPYVVYCRIEDGEAKLCIAQKDGDNWEIDTLAISCENVGRFSMDLDSSGNPWIAYMDNAGIMLNIIHRESGGSWIDENILTSLTTMYHPVLSLSGDEPWIAYFTGDAEPWLKLVYKDGTGFSKKDIDPNTCSTAYLDFEVDSYGTGHFSYVSITDNALKHAMADSGSWPVVINTVDNSGTENGISPALTFDSVTKAPLVSYVNVEQSEHVLKTASFDGSQWTITAQTRSNSEIRYTSIVSDSSASIHITYKDYENDSFNCLKTGSGTPEIKRLDSQRTISSPIEIQSNPAGNASIVMKNTTADEFLFQRILSSQWATERLMEIHPSVTELASDMNHHGYMGLVWTEPDTAALTTGILTFMEQTDTGWQIQTVDTDQLAANTPTVLHYDIHGVPHILYDASTVPAVRHAWRSGDQWITSDLYDNWVMYCDMDVGTDGRVHVVYEDTSFNIHYSFSDDRTTWTDTIIDTKASMGSEATIQIDTLNRPNILIMDSDMNSIRYLVHENDQWRETTIPNTQWYDTIKWDFSISDTNRYDLVLWNDTGGSVMHYWRCSEDEAWVEDAVDLRTLEIPDIALTVDPLSRPEIIYYDASRSAIFHGIYREPVWYDLGLSDTRLLPGGSFNLTREIHNTRTTSVVADEYLLLDVYGEFWFAPGWTTAVDLSIVTIDAETSIIDFPLTFTWPDGTGEATGIRFWGGIVESGTANVLDYDMVMFEWAE